MPALNSGHIKRRILQALQDAPSGKSSNELAVIVERSPSRVTTRLCELLETGRALRCKAPNGRSIWFAPQYAETARAAAERESWQFSSGVRVTRKTTVAAVLTPAPMTPGSGPRITIAPPFVDRRFAVESPAPVFSSMRPGQYLPSGSAIAAAYGEGAA